MVWNLRGATKRYKQKELHKYLYINNIRLVGLVETRVKEQKMKEVVKNIAAGWGIIHNYDTANNGRIWLIWDQNCYEVIKVQGSPQSLHCKVTDRAKHHQIMITVIYGFNAKELRKKGCGIS